jgi:hypothetical protein
MPVSVNTVDYVRVTAGASAQVGQQPADNCHTIIVYNSDGTDAAVVGILGTGVVASTATAAIVPAGSSLTLRIGTYEWRPHGGFASTSGVVLKTAAVAGAPILYFQYVNSTKPVAP